MDKIENFVSVRLSASIFIAVATLALVYWWLKPKPLDVFPHNPVTSILGDVPEIIQTIESGKASTDYFTLLVERHGPVAQVCIGKQIFLLVADRVEAERLIAGKNVDIAPVVSQMLSPLIPTSQLALPTNEMWKHHRRVLGPSMHRRYLSRMTDHVSNVADSLVKLWEAKLNIAKDNSFNTETDFRLATTDSIASISFGSSLGCVEDAIRSVRAGPVSTSNVATIMIGESTPLYYTIHSVLKYAARFPRFPFASITIPLYLWCSPTWRRDSKLLRTFLLGKVAQARQREVNVANSDGLITDAGCILDMLIQQEIREGSDALSTNEIVDELLTLFMAGQETTASALAWFAKFMPKDPEIQRRLHDEVCSVFGAGEDSSTMTLNVLSDPEKVPVLEAVTAETLRCAQIGGTVGRCLLNDDIVMGRRVPKNFNIMILTGYLGLQESEWGPDAKVWRPSRWLRQDGSFDRNAGPDGNPFGLGHRSCFGQKLALMQLKIFIATLSRAFFFKPVAPEVDRWESVWDATRKPANCYIRLERWDGASKL